MGRSIWTTTRPHRWTHEWPRLHCRTSHVIANPPSGHLYADEPRTALAAARAQVANLIGAEPDKIVFTGSGTEADALVIQGGVLASTAGT